MDPTADKQQWLGAATPVYTRWMKILGVAAVVANVVIEIHSRNLSVGVRLSEPVAAFVSYLATATASMFVAGAGVRIGFWVIDRRRRSGEVNRPGEPK
jgi:hypothetical protein